MTELEHEKAIEILRTAREMIRDPRRWTQHAMNRDASGRQLDHIGDSMAAKWDASGAVLSAFGQPRWIGPAWLAYAALVHFLPANTALAQFNDAPDTTHAQVLELFNHAIGWLKLETQRKAPRRKVAA